MTMAVCDHVERVPFTSLFRGEAKGDTATLASASVTTATIKRERCPAGKIMHRRRKQQSLL